MSGSYTFYGVALRKRQSEKDFFFEQDDFQFIEANIDTYDRYWYADPFLFEKGDKTYLFFEAFDLIKSKGLIAYCTIDDDGRCSKPHFVLERPYHFSFPCLFKCQEQIYMLPETCGDNKVRLFKSVEFPDVWQEDAVLLDNIYACDSIVYQRDKVSKLIISEMPFKSGKKSPCYVVNKLYNFNGNKKIDEHATVIGEGELGIRNGGKIYDCGDKLIRIGQNCEGMQYGKGLMLWQIKKWAPYEEKCIYKIDCNGIKKHLICSDKFLSKRFTGVHTYNISNKWEVIDFSYEEDNVALWTKIRRLPYKWNRSLKKRLQGKI